MPGQLPMNRRITVGSTRALIDWYVATRSVPVSPARSAAMSARAASSLATIASACRSSSSPASVIEIARGPPGRSISFSPTIRSSAAICWLTADCV